VSQDFGPGTMSVILTHHGLALRWPGEIDPPLAAFIRDLLVDMRQKMLAHVDRKARVVAEDVAYRVAADAMPEAAAADEDVSAARRA